MKSLLFAALAFSAVVGAQTRESPADLAARYLPALIRLDTTNPPGNETRVALDRDIILLSESDEEAGSLGATWMVAHAWPKIDAEFAINEYSYILTTRSGVPVFQIQTAEKVPTRFKMTARGTAGHGSLPRD